jgi:hypothetical protein
MEDHETRRKVIRQWMSLPKDKRQTPDQAAEFAKKAVEQNELQPSRRDPYERVVGWLLPRTGRWRLAIYFRAREAAMAEQFRSKQSAIWSWRKMPL